MLDSEKYIRGRLFMEQPQVFSYCQAAGSHPAHQAYHDTEYGFPLRDDNALFERLALEINQAGLSWLTILKKKDNFHRAFDGFDIDTVAAYGDADRARLLAQGECSY
jgi:DNA-3-methyladenine glycosylase I